MGLFQSFWHGKGLPSYQQLALKSFIDHGHGFILYSFDDLEVPAGVELRDAAAVLPRDRLFLDRPALGRSGVAAFSDLFRFHLLDQVGGWWVDADVICLSPEIAEPDFCLGWQDHRLVGTAIMRLLPGTPLTQALCTGADAGGPDVRFGEIGPALLTRAVRQLGLVDQVSAREALYPVGPFEALHLLLPSRADEVREKLKDASLLHMWNEIFTRAAILGWVAPPPGSIMRELFLRHGIPVSSRFSYSAAELERINHIFLRATDAGTLARRVRKLEAEAETLRSKLQDTEDALAALRLVPPATWRG